MSSFDDIATGSPIVVSATLYTTYLQCPQQALGRLRGIYGPPSFASFKGILAHKVFARHLDSGPIDAESFEQVCRMEAGAQLGGQMAQLRMKPSQFRAMVGEIEGLYERFSELPTDGFRAAERAFELDAGGDVTIRGQVDAVFDDSNGTRIVDWKTGTFLGGAEEQLAFYAMAWNLEHGKLPAVTEATSLATGEKVVTEPTSHSIDETTERVRDMVEALRKALDESSDLARVAGPYCQWCPLLDDCEEGAAAVALL